MNHELARRIHDCSALPSLPAIALQVLELVHKDDSDIAEIAKVISKDPALSSKILRTVNSSFYGRGQKVGTISHALVILGLQSVKTLVLGFSLVTHLSKNKNKGFQHVTYWRRSIYAATAARTIAAKVAQVQGEECFLAALLMDIGMLVLDQTLGEEYGALLEKAATHAQLPAVEEAALQMNHADVAGLLAEQWKLPPVLATPMAKHHVCEEVTDEALRHLTRVVYLASRCADVFTDEQPAGAIKDVRDFCLGKYKLSAADCDALLADIGRRTKEVAALFEIAVGPETFESVLKRANDALIELTLSTQRRAASLAVQTHTLHKQAAQLQQQNRKLQVQASTDGLTGLSNRAMLDKFLAETFTAAHRGGRLLALLLLDLDRFKNVNDAHGHAAGDAVLRAVAGILCSVIRKSDLAARYGGEELALVLPEANRAYAASIAEKVRGTITAHPVCLNGTPVPVTASVGVAVYEPGGPFTEVAHLFKAADLALYAAKHAGRNCVKVFALPPAAKTTAA